MTRSFESHSAPGEIMFSAPPVLTYCTNIHPGESWREIFTAVRQHAPVVKKSVSPDTLFPIGLRLSGRAAKELSLSEAGDFRNWCRQEGFYVATLNGFPYGTFHHAPVKQAVYLPDWRSVERLNYTRKLADLLAIWLPDGMIGSISTVPIGFRSCISREDLPTVKGISRRHSIILIFWPGDTGRKSCFPSSRSRAAFWRRLLMSSDFLLVLSSRPPKGTSRSLL